MRKDRGSKMDQSLIFDSHSLLAESLKDSLGVLQTGLSACTEFIEVTNGAVSVHAEDLEAFLTVLVSPL
jgi:hypothetical protein